MSRIGRVAQNPAPATATSGTATPEPPNPRTAEPASWYRRGGAAYYQEIFVDPYRVDTIWSVNTNLDWSRDGGKTWQQTTFETNTGMHVDHHVVEFDPVDPNHVLIGNDGGLYETYDLGKSFRFFASRSPSATACGAPRTFR